jgi:hypothetical protein
MLIKLISFPSPAENKVSGIKALRAAFGIGLKDAKDLIEDLQEGNESTLECLDREALRDFERSGGVVGEVNEVLIDQLKTTAKSAVDGQSYELALDVIELLKKYTA